MTGPTIDSILGLPRAFNTVLHLMCVFGQDNVEFGNTLSKTMVSKVLRRELAGDETGWRTQ